MKRVDFMAVEIHYTFRKFHHHLTIYIYNMKHLIYNMEILIHPLRERITLFQRTFYDTVYIIKLLIHVLMCYNCMENIEFVTQV